MPNIALAPFKRISTPHILHLSEPSFPPVHPAEEREIILEPSAQKKTIRMCVPVLNNGSEVIAFLTPPAHWRKRGCFLPSNRLPTYYSIHYRHLVEIMTIRADVGLVALHAVHSHIHHS
ncbi:hypothetical protein JMJ77_0004367 [Colletotrichum scovillei]|uniref:Uncharacterized protein n=1 Tax=Colletotrichum scovillei TaxID=1209932 RepID=A0A9P7U908_9PEZI|nr:hypothetical protein JMJ77_0004367 [Colletotrichum scovillei]KAG7049619.1 hypothetical protein JMJ78_0013599 [Colletotrichum scovillei]KAG7064361.1 hypothetical protein JMJ76_0007406 [Colletotrichum scovillei]